MDTGIIRPGGGDGEFPSPEETEEPHIACSCLDEREGIATRALGS